MKTNLKLHLLLLTLLSLAGSAPAQGTAIGYQGRLNDGGLPATGLYDFTFAVFGAEADGAALAGPLPFNAVPVTNGLFNVGLDFGPDVFTGPARWLEITVRASGVGDPMLLTPRTPLLPTPYAIFASKAGAVASGTLTADQLNSGGVPPAPGQFLSYDGGSFLWKDPVVDGVWSVLNGNAHYDAGNVGIGTSAPAHRLSLSGGPNWTGNNWAGAVELANGAAIGWQANQGEQRFGMGHSFGGFYLFRTQSDPGTTGSPALYDFVVNDVGNVGIGTTTPSGRLQVNGGWDGEQGALQLSGHRPTLRFTGDADSGNESWLLHLGGDGPLGFFRRTGPGAWNPVMQLTTSGRQMEIYGQDALGLIGSQPFLTLFDTSSGNAASRIQASGGDLFLEPASYIAGQYDTGLVIKNDSGNVGIGTLAPVAKLHAETSEVKPAVYGNATGAGTGVYGRSATGVAVYADGNAGQARDKGGFVKAMAYIDPFLPADQYVVRCYNSQQPGNAASTAPCGITVTRKQAGDYIIDFGFHVRDRFISVTPSNDGVRVSAGTHETIGPNQVYVVFGSADDPNVFPDSAFFIFVF